MPYSRAALGRVITNVIGFDDAPFERTHRGDVLLIGAVFSRTRLDGVVSARDREAPTLRAVEPIVLE